MNDTTCPICGTKNVDSCQIRSARGRVCLLLEPVPAPRPQPANEFSSYAEAIPYARAHGGRIISIGVSGGPKRFVVK